MKPRYTSKIKNTSPAKNLFFPDTDLDVGAVYKLTFDNNFFYIGGTKNARKRLGIYRSQFKRCSINHNKKIMKCLNDCIEANFEILEVVEDLNAVFDTETKWIKLHFGNKFLINRSQDAYSNNGVKFSKRERKSISKKLKGIKRSSTTGNRRSQLVEKYDLNEILLGTYISVSAAAKSSGCCGLSVANVLNGKKYSHNGYHFKYVDAPIKEIINVHPKPKENFYQINNRGEIVNETNDYKSLAAELKVSPGCISGILNNRKVRHKTVRGFYFVYVTKYNKEYFMPKKYDTIIVAKDKTVSHFDKNMMFVKKYKNMSAAVRELDITSSGATMCLTGNNKSSHGFVFKYAS